MQNSTPWGKDGRRLVLGAGLLFALMAGLGTNPWLVPNLYDNVLYHEAAKSLLAGEGYCFNGQEVADWPPLQSMLLAVVYAVTGPSVAVGKLVNILTALVAMFLGWRLLLAEKRVGGPLAVALLVLFPTSLLVATSIASDWLFVALSFGFLLVVQRMRSHRRFSLALTAGLLLGAASLTRYPGVLLGVVLIVSALRIATRGGTWRLVWLEFVAALVGFAVWLCWIGHLIAAHGAGELHAGNYETDGASLFGDIGLFEFATQWADLLLQWENVAARFGMSAGLAGLLALIPLLLMGVGLWQRFAAGKGNAIDAYVIATLALLLFYHWKVGRYFLPIAPFLLCYLFDGTRAVAGKLTGMRWARMEPAVVGAWVVALVAGNLLIVFVQGSEHRAPLSPLVTKSEEAFYRGYWKDLYHMSQALEARQARVVATGRSFQKYVLPWSTAQRIECGRNPRDWDHFLFDREAGDPRPSGAEAVLANEHFELFERPGSVGIVEGGER